MSLSSVALAVTIRLCSVVSGKTTTAKEAFCYRYQDVLQQQSGRCATRAANAWSASTYMKCHICCEFPYYLLVPIRLICTCNQRL